MNQKTLKPRTIFCHDNLPILRGINSDSIDLIYLDPPFNKGQNFHAPIGSTAEGADFKDIWSPDDIKDEWHIEINNRFPKLYKFLDAVGDIGSRSAKYYLIYMAVRLLEMHRILKDTGSIYLHCDPTASHYLKLLMDTIFGHANFCNEIIWCYLGMPSKAHKWQSKHDIILFYAKGKERTFNVLTRPPTEESQRTFESAKRRGYNANNARNMVTVFDRDKYEQAVKDGKIPSGLRESEFTGGHAAMQDWWSDIKILGGPHNKERVGYPTQKPRALLERIIEASSHKGDIVLDPFCGCATTCVAAENLERDWVGIDVSKKAYELVKMRLKKEIPVDMWRAEPIFRNDILVRTDENYKRKITKEDKQFLFGTSEGKCAGCKVRFDLRHFEIDHIIPKSQGGGNDITNLQLLCGSCNKIKGSRPMEYLRSSLKNLGVT